MTQYPSYSSLGTPGPHHVFLEGLTALLEGGGEGGPRTAQELSGAHDRLRSSLALGERWRCCLKRGGNIGGGGGTTSRQGGAWGTDASGSTPSRC